MQVETVAKSWCHRLKGTLILFSQVLESTTKKQLVTREGDPRSAATCCPLMCRAATPRSGVETLRAKGEGPAHLAKDAHRPYRNRCFSLSWPGHCADLSYNRIRICFLLLDENQQSFSGKVFYSILCLIYLQVNTSDSPAHSDSESGTPRNRRQLPQTPSRPRPYISYSPLVCRTQTSSTTAAAAASNEGQSQPQDTPAGPTEASLKVDKESRPLSAVQGSSGVHVSGPSHPSPHRYISEPYLPFHEDLSSGEASEKQETLTFETAVATSLGRANAISSAPQLRHSWQVPNGHFRKHLGQTSPAGASELLSDTDEDDRC